MKALPPPKPNEISALRDSADTSPQPPSRPPTLDHAILQAFAADTAKDTRTLLQEAMTAYGGTCDPDWLDAVCGVFEP